MEYTPEIRHIKTRETPTKRSLQRPRQAVGSTDPCYQRTPVRAIEERTGAAREEAPRCKRSPADGILRRHRPVHLRCADADPTRSAVLRRAGAGGERKVGADDIFRRCQFHHPRREERVEVCVPRSSQRPRRGVRDVPGQRAVVRVRGL